MAAKLLKSHLLLKLELMHNQTCKTSRLKTAANTLMDLSSSLIKVNYNSEELSHESFRKSFKKS